MKIKRVILTTLPLCLSAISLMSCNGIKFTKQESVKLYLGRLDDVQSLTDIYFSDSKKGIPFIDLKYGAEFFAKLVPYLAGDKYYKLTAEVKDNVYQYKRENNTTLKFDFNNNTIECDNISLFRQSGFAKNEYDSSDVDPHFYDKDGKVIENEVRYLLPKSSQIFKTEPNPMVVYLNNYNIKMYRQGDKYLVPFTTFYNIVAPTGSTCIFNGKSFFFSGQALSQLGDAYTNEFYNSFTPTTRSKELIEYNYNEFVRDLDYTYGLAEEHGISSFDKYFSDNGIKKLLMSESRYDEDKAYMMLQYANINDGHTGFTSQNAYGGNDSTEAEKIIKEIPLNPQYVRKESKMSERAMARSIYKNTMPLMLTGKTGTEEGEEDTLIITFDKFASNAKGIDFYYSDEFKYYEEGERYKDYIKNNPTDSVALIHFANKIIKNDTEGKIKNVVLDLSGNTGGQAHTALFTLGWFDSATMQLQDPINGGYGATSYFADINLDKNIDGDDLLVFSNPIQREQWRALGKKVFDGNVYCLTSETSFSCGNYVPAMLKQTGLAKLIGTKSGGGACIVRVSSTADGSGFCFSGNKKLCRVKNGSFYSIDEGVDPDYILDNYDTLYGTTKTLTEIEYSKREKLVDYIETKIQ